MPLPEITNREFFELADLAGFIVDEIIGYVPGDEVSHPGPVVHSANLALAVWDYLGQWLVERGYETSAKLRWYFD